MKISDLTSHVIPGWEDEVYLKKDVNKFLETYNEHESGVQSIFVIQVYEYEKRGSLRNERTYGWMPTFELAEQTLIMNSSVLSEEVEGNPYYPYAVIEEVPMGIMSADDEGLVHFYDWDYKNCKYKNCDIPAIYKGSVGFTMG